MAVAIGWGELAEEDGADSCVWATFGVAEVAFVALFPSLSLPGPAGVAALTDGVFESVTSRESRAIAASATAACWSVLGSVGGPDCATVSLDAFAWSSALAVVGLADKPAVALVESRVAFDCEPPRTDPLLFPAPIALNSAASLEISGFPATRVFAAPLPIAFTAASPVAAVDAVLAVVLLPLFAADPLLAANPGAAVFASRVEEGGAAAGVVVPDAASWPSRNAANGEESAC
jgi:hypothetical protein